MSKPELPPVMAAPGMFANETACYPATMVTTNGIWVGEDPMQFALPAFLFQALIMVLTTRLFMFLLKPFHMPRIFSEFMAGIILGPSTLGKLQGFGDYIFQKRTLILLETIANMGVVYFLFMIGLETDISMILKHSKKAISVAFSSIFLPFLIAWAFSFLLQPITTMQMAPFIILFGIALSLTSMPVLSRILGELRLVDLEMGELARSVAFVSHLFGVVLIVFAISLAESETPFVISLWVILASMAFVAVCFLVARPAIGRLLRSRPEDESFGDLATSIILAGIMFSGVITDVIGVHPAFGAFIFGLVIPNGPLAVTLIEKLEDFVNGFLLPLFFVTCALKTNISKIQGFATWITLLSAILLAVAGKVVGTLIAALSIKMPFSEGVALGLLLNTKGFIELVALNIGKDQKVIDDTGYAIFLITAIVMNGIVSPLLSTTYRPARKFVAYKRRTIQKTTTADCDLRILACIHTPRNVPTIINLLEASYPTKRSPLSVFSLHLVEHATGHGTATIINHSSLKSETPAGINRMQAQSDHINNAFETFKHHSYSSVSLQSLTAVSPYNTMHEEICNLAEEKHIAFIIIPFHRQPNVHGGMETANPKHRMVNENLLANAPCSVGILIDRCLSGSARLGPDQISHNIAVLFFGGADDREALSYALRMSEHPGNTLNVIRFLPGPEAIEMDPDSDYPKEEGVLTMQIEKDRERQLDDDLIKAMRMGKVSDESFSYIERTVNNGEETVAAIRSVDNIHDLYIVGRSEGIASPLTAGLQEWSECRELGIIGDLLASSDFAATVSVLVVQQYVGLGPKDEGMATPDSVSQQEEQYIMGSMHL